MKLSIRQKFRLIFVFVIGAFLLGWGVVFQFIVHNETSFKKIKEDSIKSLLIAQKIRTEFNSYVKDSIVAVSTHEINALTTNEEALSALKTDLATLKDIDKNFDRHMGVEANLDNIHRLNISFIKDSEKLDLDSDEFKNMVATKNKLEESVRNALKNAELKEQKDFDDEVLNFREYNKYFAVFYSIALLFVVLITLISIFFILNSVLKRILQFQKHFSTTDLESLQPLDMSGADELNDLLRASNAMLLKMKEARATLIEREVVERDREKMQTQIQQSLKLASLGMLGAGVAHELNNPLVGVRGFAQLIVADKKIDPKIAKYAENIVTASFRMQKIIDHFRRFAKDSSHEKMKPISLKSCIDDSLVLLNYKLNLMGIQVKVDVEKDLYILGVKNEVESIFHNLISNARDAFEQLNDKREKRITISVKEQNKMAFVQVQDNASGISKESLAHIFDPFFTTKQVGKGLGLGLSILHSVVKNHKGEITVESTPMVGTSFFIKFPISESQEVENNNIDVVAPEKAIAAPAVKQSVLALDDEQLVLDILDSFLGDYFDLSVFLEGEKACEALTKRKYDLIITDMRMPKMDGLEFIAHIRNKLHLDTPIVVITGHAQTPAEVRDILAHGAQKVIFKPFSNKNDLIHELVLVSDPNNKLNEPNQKHENESVKALEEVKAETPKGPISGEAGKSGKPSLFIVDDEEVICEVLTMYMSEDFEVETESNAVEAMKKLEQKSYECMLLDLNMPVMSGEQIIGKLKEMASPTKVYIITGSEKENPQCRRCLDNGASGIFTKPFNNIKELIETIKRSIE